MEMQIKIDTSFCHLCTTKIAQEKMLSDGDGDSVERKIWIEKKELFRTDVFTNRLALTQPHSHTFTTHSFIHMTKLMIVNKFVRMCHNVADNKLGN